MWKQQAWLDTHLQTDLALERFNKLIGIHPAKAKGTKTPTIQTRASVAHLDHMEDSDTTRKLYQVGEGWMRVASRIDAAANEVVTGYLAEPQATNEFIQSEDMGTSWILQDAGDTVGGSVVTPDKSTSVLSGLIADSTNGNHGWVQSVTLTVAPWVWSCFVKKGNADWFLLWNNTAANTTAYFNLAAGTIGNVASNVTKAFMEDWGDGLWRVGMTWVGTAASNALQHKLADANGTSTFSGGDGAAVNMYVWGTQIELGSRMTSYVPTVLTTETRAADALQYKGDDGNIKDVGKGNVQVSVLVEDYTRTQDGYICNLSDGGATQDRVSLYQRTSGDVSVMETRAAGGDQGDAIGSSDIADGYKHDLIGSWNTNAVAIAVESL